MAVDTYSATLGWLQMGTGNDNNTWGALANSGVFSIFENAIAGSLSLTMSTGLTNSTLVTSLPPAGPSLAGYGILNLTGTGGISGTNPTTLQVPNLTMKWVVFNNTTGDLVMQTPAGGTICIPVGTHKYVWCDGANNLYRHDRDDVGEFKSFGIQSIPPGFMELTGPNISQVLYPDLFNKMGFTWSNTLSGSLGANPFSTVLNSNVVTVTLAQTVAPGNFIFFSGVSAFNGVNLNGLFTVETIVSLGASFTINAAGLASAGGSGGGSSAIYQLSSLTAGLFGLPTVTDTGRFLRSRIPGTTDAGTYMSNALGSHTHTINDPGHHHTINDPGHTHSTSDPGHVHGVSDPGHLHQPQSGAGAFVGVDGAGGPGVFLGSGSTTFTTPTTTDAVATGISINNHVTNLSIISDTTGITRDVNATTGITVNNAGSAETRPETAVVRMCVRY